MEYEWESLMKNKTLCITALACLTLSGCGGGSDATGDASNGGSDTGDNEVEIIAGALYVSPDGDDANDGHLTSEGGTGPWKTLQKAASTAVAGEVVYVRSGEYKEPGPIAGSDKLWGVRVLNDGEEGKPIVFAGYPKDDAKPVVDMDYEAPCFTLYGRQHVVIKGFEMRECRGAGVWVMSGSGRDNLYLSIANNYIHHINGGAGTNVAGVRMDTVGYGVIANNRIHHIRVDGVDNGNAAGVLSYRMYETTINNNEFYDAHSGVFHKAPDYEGRKGGVFRNNLIHDVSKAFYFNTNTSVPAPGAHVNTEIRQNVVYGVETFIYDWTFGSNTQNKGLKVSNNTVIGANLNVRGFTEFEFHHNILFGGANITTTYQEDVFTNDQKFPPGLKTVDYNLYSEDFTATLGRYSSETVNYASLAEWQVAGATFDKFSLNVPNGTPDINSATTSDPKFQNLGGHDYRLKPESPALHPDGNIGAYIKNTDQIGPDW